MKEIIHLQKQIDEIKERNSRVEKDKWRETSWARKIAIALLTYIVVVIFFYAAKLPNPWINAIVPTLGFTLSTLSLGVLKKIREKNQK